MNDNQPVAPPRKVLDIALYYNGDRTELRYVAEASDGMLSAASTPALALRMMADMLERRYEREHMTNDQPTTGYDKHLADEEVDLREHLDEAEIERDHADGRMTDETCPAPEQRVRAYLDAMEEHEKNRRDHGWSYGDTIHSFNDIELNRTDLRDVLNELDAVRDAFDKYLRAHSETVWEAQKKRLTP